MYVVLCNCPPDRAEGIARSVVEERLAACVNLVGPVTSIYEWEGKVETAQEITLILKVSEEDVIAAINDKSLKAKKMGNAYRISKAALEEFLAS